MKALIFRIHIAALFIACFCSPSFAQKRYSVNLTLQDCLDSVTLAHGTFVLKKNGKKVKTIQADDKGKTCFKNLNAGKYDLTLSYFYYPTLRRKLIIPKDTSLVLCIRGEQPDSLVAKYKAQGIYTLYYFGKPFFSDEYLATVGKKYGVRYNNLGCVMNDAYKRYNEIVERILTKRNGEGWQDKFWDEAREKYKAK